MASVQKTAKRASRKKQRAPGGRAYPVGEQHHLAILSDHEAELLIALRREGYSWAWLARKFEVSIRGCRDIYSGRRRGVVTGRARW
jgi:hypothetical protein